MKKEESIAIVGFGETPTSRGRADKGELRLSTEEYIAWAADLALQNAGLTKKDIDHQGLAVAGTTTRSGELWSSTVAHNLGLNPKLLLRGDQGGMSPTSFIVQSYLAIRAGLVDTVLCVGGEAQMSEPITVPTLRHEWEFGRPFGMMGPNSLFAFVMKRHMYQYGTKFEDSGHIAVVQRQHACLNPNAYMKKQITLDEYMQSRMISDPIRLLDCCLPVDSGLAFIVTSLEKAKKINDRPIYLLGFGECDNYYHGSYARPDITFLGVRVASKEALKMAGLTNRDVSFFEVYDDYTIAVLMQIEDAGFCEKGQFSKFIKDNDISYKGQLPVNTGGGQLSSGQPSMSGGFVGVVEAIRQLKGQGEMRQVKDANVGMVTGIGGLAYAGNLINNQVLLLGV